MLQIVARHFVFCPVCSAVGFTGPACPQCGKSADQAVMIGGEGVLNLTPEAVIELYLEYIHGNGA